MSRRPSKSPRRDCGRQYRLEIDKAIYTAKLQETIRFARKRRRGGKKRGKIMRLIKLSKTPRQSHCLNHDQKESNKHLLETRRKKKCQQRMTLSEYTSFDKNYNNRRETQKYSESRLYSSPSRRHRNQPTQDE